MVFLQNLTCFYRLCTYQADRIEVREHKASQHISIGIPEMCLLASRSRVHLTVYCMDLALPTFLKLCSLDALAGGTDSSSLDQRETVGSHDLAAVLVD